MNAERGFVPIADAQSERVFIKISFPEFVEDQKIGVNVREIHRLCQIGGIKRLGVIGIDDLDTSRAVPQVLGFNEQGSAYIGKAVSKQETPFSQSHTGDSQGFYHTERWADALIAVNMTELKERIAHDKRWSEGVCSPAAWSYYLDKGIKDGISNEGALQLLSLNPKARLAMFAFVIAVDASMGPENIFLFHPHLLKIPDPVSLYFANSFAWNTLERLVGRVISNRNNSRFTLFYGPEVDRAVLLKILTKTRTLVKQIEPQSRKANPTLDAQV